MNDSKYNKKYSPSGIFIEQYLIKFVGLNDIWNELKTDEQRQRFNDILALTNTRVADALNQAMLSLARLQGDVTPRH